MGAVLRSGRVGSGRWLSKGTARRNLPRGDAQDLRGLLAKRPDDRPRGALEVIDRIDELSRPRRRTARGTGSHAALDLAALEASLD